MILRPGKYLQHPLATEAEWIARNPTLKNGEEGYAIVDVNGITHVRKKVGPGAWNDLTYYDGVVWTDTTPVTNPIGDAEGNLAGLTPIQIINLMLNEYQIPVVSGVTNNAGGSFANVRRIEIGTNITAPIVVKYTVSNQANLKGTNPITVTANGVFDNEGTFPLGDVTLVHGGFYPTDSLYRITISVKAAHQNGNSNTATTRIDFDPAIISGVASSKPADGDGVLGMPNKVFKINRNYNGDYSYGYAGFAVVAIPTILSPSNLQFTDVTPGAPQGAVFAMEDLGAMSLDGYDYDHQVYSSPNSLISPSVLNIS